MQSALQKLPPWNGIAFRGASLSPALLDAYRSAALSGTTLSEPGFVSGTPDASLQLPGGDLLVIESRSARDISVISATPQFREVVFPAASVFLPLALDRLDSGHHAVLLVEAEPRQPGGDPTAALARPREALRQRLQTPPRGEKPPPGLGERLSGAVGISESGTPYPAAAASTTAAPSPLQERLREAVADAAARPALLQALRQAELFAAVAGPERPSLVPAQISGRLALPLYTSREAVSAATGGRLHFTRAPAPRLLAGVPSSLPVVLDPGSALQLELTAAEIQAIVTGT